MRPLGHRTNVKRDGARRRDAQGTTSKTLDVLHPKDIETAFRAAGKGRADAVFTLANAVLLSQRTQITDLAVKSRLPAIYHRQEFVDDGGLMSYDTKPNELARRTATYVDKIVKGQKPADQRAGAGGQGDQVMVDNQWALPGLN